MSEETTEEVGVSGSRSPGETEADQNQMEGQSGSSPPREDPTPVPDAESGAAEAADAAGDGQAAVAVEEDEDDHFLLPKQDRTSAEDDRLGHTAHVETLERIVTEVDGPWRIGLYGDWGAGKSFIVDLLYNRIRKAQAGEHYRNDYLTGEEPLSDVEPGASEDIGNTLCVKLNAWKHAEGAVRTELLLDLNQELQAELDRRFGEDETSGQSSGDDTGDLSTRRRLRRAGSQVRDGAFRILPGVVQAPFLPPVSEDQGPLADVEDGVVESEEIVRYLYDVYEDPQEERRSLRERLREIDPWSARLTLYTVLGTGLVYFASTFIQEFDLNLTSALIGAIGFLAVSRLQGIFDEIQEEGSDTTQTLSNPRKDWSGAYDRLFDTIIEQTREEYERRQQTDDPAELEKIVVTIDDLDRCEGEVVYEILVALKSFVENDSCIYIVPCDKKVLYEHLETAEDGDYLGDTLDKQNFLDKFFENEIEVPTATNDRLHGNYLDEQIRRLDGTPSQDVREVIEAAQLSTPRQVRQALNRVITLQELAENRGDISIEEGDGLLAKVSILKKEFPYFYQAIENDPDQLVAVQRELQSGVRDDRRGVFTLLNEMDVPDDRQRALVGFLTRTSEYRVDPNENPAKYFRLAGDTLSRAERFERHFRQGRAESLRRTMREADPEEHGDFAAFVRRQLNSETARYDAFETTLRILDEFKGRGEDPESPEDDDGRGVEYSIQLAREMYDLLREEPGVYTSGLLLADLYPLIKNLPDARGKDDRRGVIPFYIESLVTDDGFQYDRLHSLATMDLNQELLLDDAVQETFEHVVSTARQTEVIGDDELAKIHVTVKEDLPELYTPQFVRSVITHG